MVCRRAGDMEDTVERDWTRSDHPGVAKADFRRTYGESNHLILRSSLSHIMHHDLQYLIINLGMSPSFQKQDFKHLQFPSKLFVDYIRVYQRSDVKDGVTCDPPSRPTKDYINR